MANTTTERPRPGGRKKRRAEEAAAKDSATGQLLTPEQAEEAAFAKIAERDARAARNLAKVQAEYADARRELAEKRNMEMMQRVIEQVRYERAGRPMEITEEQIYAVLALHAEGMGMRAACKAVGVTFSNVWNHCENKPQYQAAFMRARISYAHAIVDGAAERVEQEMDPHKARIIADLIKFEASKIHPKVFGDRLPDALPNAGVTFNFNLGAPPSNERIVGQSSVSPGGEKEKIGTATDYESAVAGLGLPRVNAEAGSEGGDPA